MIKSEARCSCLSLKGSPAASSHKAAQSGNRLWEGYSGWADRKQTAAECLCVRTPVQLSRAEILTFEAPPTPKQMCQILSASSQWADSRRENGNPCSNQENRESRSINALKKRRFSGVRTVKRASHHKGKILTTSCLKTLLKDKV